MERRPALAPFLTAPIKPLIQQLLGQFVILVEALAIANDAVIVPVSSQLGRQRFHQLWHLAMATAAQPLSHALHRALLLLARGSSFDRGPAFPAWLPAIFKSQEVKPPVILASIAAKPYRLGLFRGHFQPVLPQ